MRPEAVLLFARREVEVALRDFEMPARFTRALLILFSWTFERLTRMGIHLLYRKSLPYLSSPQSFANSTERNAVNVLIPKFDLACYDGSQQWSETVVEGRSKTW